MPTQYKPLRLALRVIGPSIAYLPLTRGQFALIDSADADFLEQWKWHAVWYENVQSFYAVRGQTITTGPKEKYVVAFKMHRVLLGLGPEDETQGDHANGNTLDDRRVNLRKANCLQNAWNHRVSKANTSGIKGVALVRGCMWRVRITVDGREIHVGYFRALEKAKAARRAAELKYHGEFARLA